MKEKSQKINASKSKLMVLGVEEELEFEVCVVGMQLEHVSRFKYLRRVLDESGTDDAECSGGRRIVGAIRYLVNAIGLQL